MIAASGFVLIVVWPTPVTLYLSAALLGLGIGIATPLGFAHLAATIPAERMGRSMGTAELGRELGDAGGPLLIGAVATAAGVTTGLGVLAGVLGIIAGTTALALRHHSPSKPDTAPRNTP
ncbi:MFS transporter [Subtercola frigoramans]|uniref:MFS family permease n=1 Tax=Subtercola frigoramans TaxID=120298 RepID=A0ABS2L0P7_9MICO|nr:MFS transporter [Subtercola frigoramans]MBM7470614.1 MFS family permease [Subtercola frigoramans]